MRCPGPSADLVYIQQDKEGCPADLSLLVLPGLLSPEPTALWATFCILAQRDSWHQPEAVSPQATLVKPLGMVTGWWLCEDF